MYSRLVTRDSTAVTCDAPGTIANGVPPTVGEYKLDSIYTYTCLPGFLPDTDYDPIVCTFNDGECSHGLVSHLGPWYLKLEI